MQAEIFFFLAAKKPIQEWYKCEPKAGSLFIVGDPKQSIYRFRNADVTSFLRVKKLFNGTNGDVLYLTRNFRSTRNMCSFFNRKFSAILPEETLTQSKYEDIPLPDENKYDEFEGQFIYKAYTGSAAGEYPEQTDAKQVGYIVNQLVGNKNHLITTPGDEIPREIRYSDIMLITTSKKNLQPFIEEFESRGIPTRVEGKVPFEICAPLAAIYDIYVCAADDRNQLALYRALIGSLINCSKDDILEYKKTGRHISLKNKLEECDCLSDGAKRVFDSMLKLKAINYEASRLSPAALFEKIIDELRIFNIVDADNLEVVYYTLELLRNAERTGTIVSLGDGAKYLDDLVSGKADEERCLSLRDNVDAVHLANLHKVKGLEAPIVILTYAWPSNPSVTLRIEHNDNSTEGYLIKMAQRKDDGEGEIAYFQTTEHSGKKDDEVNCLKDEKLRLVYVAATRARNALIMCQNLGKDGNPKQSMWAKLMENTPDIFTVLSTKEDEEHKPIESVLARELYDAAERESVLSSRNGEVASYSIMTPSMLKIHSKIVDETFEVEKSIVIENKSDSTKKLTELEDGEELDEFSKARQFRILLGTMTHKLMEMLVSTNYVILIEEAVDEILKEYTSQDDQQYQENLRKVLISVGNKMITSGYNQTNGLPANLFEEYKQSDEVYCELPFCYKEVLENGTMQIWDGVMDAVYYKDGKWHIIDYKTNADGSNLDMKYAGQLEAYKKAFKIMMGVEADAFTYHINV